MRFHEFTSENFADGKHPGRKGLAKRSGVNTKASVSSLRNTAKHSTGEKARMAHWLANMKAGRAKHKSANESEGDADGVPHVTKQLLQHIVQQVGSEGAHAIIKSLKWGDGASKELLHLIVRDLEQDIDSVDEGWKDWVAGAAMGAAALGANASIVKQIVEPGDTVYSIARQNGVDPTVVMQLNKFNNATKLEPGQKVKVPDNTKPTTASHKQDVKHTAAPAIKEPVKKIDPTEAESTLKNIAMKAGLMGTELAQFMAQCQHETADFTHMKEIGGSLDFKKYDPKFAPKKAKILGNKHAGDGSRYAGRGYIQITGRDNYRMAGEALGLPLEEKPELASTPTVAAKIAVWYWKTRVAPHVNNFNDTAAVTKKINPGMRGLEDRQDNFKDYKNVLVAMR
jgi:predicted chitinase